MDLENQLQVIKEENSNSESGSDFDDQSKKIAKKKGKKRLVRRVRRIRKVKKGGKKGKKQVVKKNEEKIEIVVEKAPI